MWNSSPSVSGVDLHQRWCVLAFPSLQMFFLGSRQCMLLCLSGPSISLSDSFFQVHETVRIETSHLADRLCLFLGRIWYRRVAVVFFVQWQELVLKTFAVYGVLKGSKSAFRAAGCLNRLYFSKWYIRFKYIGPMLLLCLRSFCLLGKNNFVLCLCTRASWVSPTHTHA